MLILIQKLHFGNVYPINDVIIQNHFENDVITKDMKSAEILLLNYQTLGILDLVAFSDKLRSPISPFIAYPCVSAFPKFYRWNELAYEEVNAL